jgi:signal transduction histidine kinase
MQLAQFILRDMEAILKEWESFAATQLPPAADMDSPALRDHAELILTAVVEDLSTPQDESARVLKSKGLARGPIDARHTAAETHALLRAQSGFNINQMISEYRALRASVLHLWANACEPSGTNAPDMIRFNEAIDQAVAESVAFFDAQIEHERNLFLGMLGHDMRSPLQVIEMTTTYLSKLSAGNEVETCAARLSKSTRSIKALLDDLIDFNRTKLGLGISIAPGAVDLQTAFTSEIDQLRVAYPNRLIELEANGNVSGVWDINRINQLLGNLVVNALKYGAFTSPVKIALKGLPAEVCFSVHNYGPTIDPALLSQIFEPLKRGTDRHLVSASDASMGLGLYIAREIVNAHGGTIAATSSDNETVFTVRLPRLALN